MKFPSDPKMILFRVLKAIKEEFDGWVRLIIISLPNTSIGFRIRRLYWSFILSTDGLKVIGRSTDFISQDRLHIGKNFYVGSNVMVDNCNSYGCYFGDNVGIGSGVYIRTANHNFSVDDLSRPWMTGGHNAKLLHHKGAEYSVVIEDNVWIGANCILLSGAHVSNGAVIAAGSVVSGFIPASSIAIGNPARVLVNREKINKVVDVAKPFTS